MTRACALWLLIAAAGLLFQVPPAAGAELREPAAASAPAIRVVVDAGHHNYHTIDGRYAPFAALLRFDGFEVAQSDKPLSPGMLQGIDVLVVANALHRTNAEAWRRPTPSAFEPEEIAALERWVAVGGALLLIADHFPFAGAAAALAAAFGFTLENGYALRTPPAAADRFTREDGSLKDHPITRGASPGEHVSVVATFTGSAFAAPADAEPLIELPPGFELWRPEEAGRFDEATPRESAGGRLQAATRHYGRGRVALFAEAGLFTAQVRADAGGTPMGFNSPDAPENARFILNTVRWLADARRANSP
jgi:hypothetical protein